MLKHAQAKALPYLISDVYQVSVIGLIYCDDSSSQNTPKSMRQAAKMPSISCKKWPLSVHSAYFKKPLALPNELHLPPATWDLSSGRILFGISRAVRQIMLTPHWSNPTLNPSRFLNQQIKLHNFKPETINFD